jgi:L-fuculose-phosphate aldolase
LNTQDRLRSKVVEISKRLYDRGLVAGAGGNVSARAPKSEEIFITPSGLCKGYLKSSQIVKVDLNGNVLKGKLKPTSETPMHTKIYRIRNDINAIVHAHPPISTGFSCANIPLDYSFYPEVIVMIGEIPLVQYVTPTTRDLGNIVAEHAERHNAFLLRSHGPVTMGSSLEQAYHRMELLEDFAKICLVSKLLGGPQPLPSGEVQKLLALETEKYRMELARKRE